MSGAGGTADPRTLAYYDADAADYAVWSSDISPREHLQRFIAALPEGGAALDLGCGGGWAAAEMMEAGLSVTALDASEGLVEQARARGVPAEVGRFEELEAVGAFDGVWISFSLLHAPLADWPGVLGRVERALKSGGTLYLGIKEGSGEVRDSLGRRYALATEGEARALLAAAGFEDIDAVREMSEQRDGAPSAILHLFGRKRAGA